MGEGVLVGHAAKQVQVQTRRTNRSSSAAVCLAVTVTVTVAGLELARDRKPKVRDLVEQGA